MQHAVLSFLALFVWGTWLFWFAAVLLVGLMFYFVENEAAFGAAVMFFLALSFLNHMAGIEVFNGIRQHPWLYLGTYLLGGVIYGFVRWSWHAAKFRMRYSEVKRAFGRENGLGDIFNPAALDQVVLSHAWQVALADARVSSIPIASGQKKRITMWMAYWPWNLVWTLLRDFVIELWEQVYRVLSTSFQRISDAIVGESIRNDFNSPDDRGR